MPKFEMIGLGKRRARRGKGILDSAKKAIQKVRDFKPATRLIKFVEENKAVRDLIPDKILNQGMKVLQTGKRYGFGKKRKVRRGKGFLGDAYNFVKKGVSKLKDLGIARKLKSLANSDIVDYGLTGLSAVAPEVGLPLIAGKKAIQKSGILDKAANLGFGKRRMGRPKKMMMSSYKRR